MTTALDKALKGTREEAPNATHYLVNGKGHWCAGTFAGDSYRDTDFGEQRCMVLVDAHGEGICAFGDKARTLIELTDKAPAIVSVGLTAEGERRLDSALTNGLKPGDKVVYQVLDKVEFPGPGGKKREAWRVKLNVPAGLSSDSAPDPFAGPDDAPPSSGRTRRAERRGKRSGRK